MKNQIENFASPLAENLGWTLVHSVWQILGFAVIYFVGYLLTKKAHYRYWLGMGILLGQLLTSIITFLILSNQHTDFQANTAKTNQLFSASSLQKVVYFLGQNMTLIVSLWAIGAGILLVRLAMGYVWVHQLKTHPNNQLNAQLSDLVENLKIRMEIGRTVLIKTSNQVNLPMIMGVVKPVILMPAALISGFSTAQLEAILAHELAHLKRHDFLFNGIQSLIEVLYFFHPVMWLISAEIRKERENCCDDMAVTYTQNKVLLAKTLVQLQEYSISSNLVLAFGKKQYSLLERIQRIVGIQQNKNFTKESLWIVGGLLITFFAFAQKNSGKTEENNRINESISAKTTSTKTDTLIANEEKHPLRITLNNDNDFTILEDKVLFNGKEVKLDAANKKLLDEHLLALKKSNAELEIKTKEIEAESQKMGEYAAQIQENSKPIQEISVKMGAVSQKMGNISQKMGDLSKQHALRLNKKGLSSEEMDKMEAEFDKQMAENENLLAKHEAELSILETQLEKLTEETVEPAVEERMHALEIPIEQYSNEIDEHVHAIVALLPTEIQQKINIEHPAPPKPPKAPKAKGIKSRRNYPSPPPPPPVPSKKSE